MNDESETCVVHEKAPRLCRRLLQQLVVVVRTSRYYCGRFVRVGGVTRGLTDIFPSPPRTPRYI